MKIENYQPGGKIMIALILCFFISCGVHNPGYVPIKPKDVVINVLPVVTDTIKKDTTVIMNPTKVIDSKTIVPSLTPITEQLQTNTEQLQQQTKILAGIDDLRVSNKTLTTLVSDLKGDNKRLSLQLSEANERYNDEKRANELRVYMQRNSATLYRYFPLWAGLITIISGVIFFFLGRYTKEREYPNIIQ